MNICISLANLTYRECLRIVQETAFAEIRLDLLALSVEQIQAIFAANTNLIATCRPGQYDDDARRQLLLTAIEAGAAYVDIEMDSSDAFKAEIIETARTKGCQIIVSYHDHEKTPERAELDHILRWCAEFDPDIIKIACMVNAVRDNARLLGLLDSDRRLLVVGMGEQGKMTRVVAPLLGSFCTFAAYSSEKSTAPGQLCRDEIEALLTRLREL